MIPAAPDALTVERRRRTARRGFPRAHARTHGRGGGARARGRARPGRDSEWMPPPLTFLQMPPFQAPDAANVGAGGGRRAAAGTRAAARRACRRAAAAAGRLGTGPCSRPAAPPAQAGRRRGSDEQCKIGLRHRVVVRTLVDATGPHVRDDADRSRSRAASHRPRSASAAPFGVVSDAGFGRVEQVSSDDVLPHADSAPLVDQRHQPGLRGRQRQRVVGGVPAPGVGCSPLRGAPAGLRLSCALRAARTGARLPARRLEGRICRKFDLVRRPPTHSISTGPCVAASARAARDAMRGCGRRAPALPPCTSTVGAPGRRRIVGGERRRRHRRRTGESAPRSRARRCARPVAPGRRPPRGANAEASTARTAPSDVGRATIDPRQEQPGGRAPRAVSSIVADDRTA